VTLPAWIEPWCVAHLGSPPVVVLPGHPAEPDLFGLRLDDGREVAVKARPDENGRVATCLEVQREGVAIHAEQWRPGGEMLRGDDPGTAALFAVLLARLVALLWDQPPVALAALLDQAPERLALAGA
jgi:hypothetical protein